MALRHACQESIKFIYLSVLIYIVLLCVINDSRTQRITITNHFIKLY